ncbi:MAG TPA: uroporphyrinogen-III synthase [Pseudohongiella sp.]|nr:uroporphyrinogen-III synthase [Pseudohongiella sp.]
MSEQTLSGVTVLLTRPVEQSAPLASALRNIGASVCELPLIEIEEVTEPESCEKIKNIILNLDQYTAAIFISINAARFGMRWIDQYWPQLPTGLSAYTVGPGTAEVLREFDWPVFYPQTGVTSEDLLALPGLKNVEGQRIALFRGVGGRELLAETLRARGAKVDYLELYRRHTPDYSGDVMASLIHQYGINAVVVSSAQILDVLLHSLHHDASLMRTIPVIVPSERVRQKALDAGLNIVVNAGGMDETAVIASLKAVASIIRPRA